MLSNLFSMKRSPKALTATFGTAMLLVLAGCGTKAPACGDESTVGLVKQVFLDSLKENRGLLGGVSGWTTIFEQPGAVTVQSIRTTVDNAGKGNLCAATLAVTFPEKAAEKLGSPVMKMILGQDPEGSAIKINANSASIEVQYTTSVTDDGKQQIIELDGHQALAEWLWGFGVTGAFGVGAADQPKTPQQQTAPDASATAPAEPAPVVSESPSTGLPSSQPAAAAKQPEAEQQETGDDGSTRIQLVSFECGVSCHLEYIGPNGKRDTALCNQADLCKQWESRARDFKRDASRTAHAQMASSELSDGKEIVDLALE